MTFPKVTVFIIMTLGMENNTGILYNQGKSFNEREMEYIPL